MKQEIVFMAIDFFLVAKYLSKHASNRSYTNRIVYQSTVDNITGSCDVLEEQSHILLIQQAMLKIESLKLVKLCIWNWFTHCIVGIIVSDRQAPTGRMHRSVK